MIFKLIFLLTILFSNNQINASNEDMKEANSGIKGPDITIGGSNA